MQIIITILILSKSLLSIANATDYTLKQFLGPQVGVENYYSGTDGSKLKLVGISHKNDKSLMLEETFYYPKESLLLNMKSHQTRVYELFVSGDKMIKKSEEKQEVVLQDPRIEDNWLIKGSMLDIRPKNANHKWREIDTTCKIVDIKEGDVLGQRTLVITKKCEYREISSIFIRTEKYGKGIGLIEQTQNVVEENGEIKGIYKLQLEKINVVTCIGN